MSVAAIQREQDYYQERGQDVSKAYALHQALHEVTNQLQILIYRRETCPIRDRDEVKTDLLLRITELNGDSRQQWRKRMIEMAAYALFAAASDQPDPDFHG